MIITSELLVMAIREDGARQVIGTLAVALSKWGEKDAAHEAIRLADKFPVSDAVIDGVAADAGLKVVE